MSIVPILRVSLAASQSLRPVHASRVRNVGDFQDGGNFDSIESNKCIFYDGSFAEVQSGVWSLTKRRGKIQPW